jgi:hypothetical protein
VDGVLAAVLCCNLLTPILEGLTRQSDYYRLRKKDVVFASSAPIPSPAEKITEEPAEAVEETEVSPAEEPAKETKAETNVRPLEEVSEVTMLDMNDEEQSDE